MPIGDLISSTIRRGITFHVQETTLDVQIHPFARVTDRTRGVITTWAMLSGLAVGLAVKVLVCTDPFCLPHILVVLDEITSGSGSLAPIVNDIAWTRQSPKTFEINARGRVAPNIRVNTSPRREPAATDPTFPMPSTV